MPDRKTDYYCETYFTTKKKIKIKEDEKALDKPICITTQFESNEIGRIAEEYPQGLVKIKLYKPMPIKHLIELGVLMEHIVPMNIA